jgi:phage anti-repressor protein
MEEDIIPYLADSNDKLTKMLTEALDGDDKQLFIINFQLYLLYGNDNKQFVVDLDNIWKWLGFARKDIAKRLIIKEFKNNTDYIIIKLTHLKADRVHGGQNKEQIMMNVETFKELCMLTNTEKGKRTRRYYSKMESIFFKYIEEKNRETIEAMKEQQKTLEQNLKKQREVDIQKKLVDAHKNTPLVYILKIQETDDVNFIIKIGETDNIEKRIISLHSEYTNCLLIETFPCSRPHAFEQYILHRKDVMKYKFVATETVKISSEFTYQNLLRIIKKHIDNFDGLSPAQKLEMAKLKNQAKIMDAIILESDVNMKQKLIDMLANGSTSKITVPDEADEDSESEQDSSPFRHRYVYQYEPTNLVTPIKTFNNLRQAARALGDQTIHDYHIKNAATNNTILNNYRWFYIDNNENPPNELPSTQETKVSTQNTGLVAQINKEKTKIIGVFSNQKEAEKETKVLNSQISTSITTGKLRNGFYWMLYDECAEELKSTYSEELPKPKRVTTCSKVVQRIDPDTNKVIETYHCIQDICNLYKCCHKSIHKASLSGDIFKCFKWNIVNSANQ